MRTTLYIPLLMGLLFLAKTGIAQKTKPEKVYSIVKVYKTYEWYSEQYDLWESALKKNKKNVEAWENTYAAARMAKIMSPSDEDRNTWYETMENVIERMEKAIPKTYEYYHLKSWHYNIWESNEEEAAEIMSWSEKAYEMNPERTEVYPDIMNNCMIKGDRSQTVAISKKWMASGEISPNLMALTYNLLMSTEKNAILLSAGDNDTYPALALQYGNNIRQDVTVINVFCAFGSETYRNRLFKNNGIPPLNGTVNGPIDVVNHVIANAGDIPVYFTYGDYINKYEELKQKTYNVGLALRYSEEDYNNTSVLLHNFETKFLLDHLNVPLYTEKFPEQVKRHNLCYLPGLMILYKHYKIVEDDKKHMATKRLIQLLVANTSHEESVNAQL